MIRNWIKKGGRCVGGGVCDVDQHGKLPNVDGSTGGSQGWGGAGSFVTGKWRDDVEEEHQGRRHVPVELSFYWGGRGGGGGANVCLSVVKKGTWGES